MCVKYEGVRRQDGRHIKDDAHLSVSALRRKIVEDLV